MGWPSPAVGCLQTTGDPGVPPCSGDPPRPHCSHPTGSSGISTGPFPQPPTPTPHLRGPPSSEEETPPPPLLLTVGPPQHPHPDTSVVGPNDDDGGVGVSSPPTGWARSSWKWVDPMAPSAAPPQRSEGAINAGPNEAMEGGRGGCLWAPPPPCPIGAAVPHRSCCATPTAAGAAAFSCCGRGASPARCWRCVGRT